MSADGHVVVTGGAGALGRVIVERLLDADESVTILDVDGVGVAHCTELFSGEDVVCLECDVSDEDEVADAMEQAAAQLGPVSGLVNCAGLSHDGAFERTGAELFRQIVEVNLTGIFIACKAVLDEMADGLSIVNLSDGAAATPHDGLAAYGAAKAGVDLMSRVMARELAQSGVRVNVVAPSAAEREAGGRPSHSQIADAVCFLLSDAASGINGHVLVVDGGR